MTPKQRLQLEQSEKRQRVNELLAADNLDDEQRSELDGLTKRLQEIEPELRAAIVAEPDPVTAPAVSGSEDRDRLELRSKVSVGQYLLAAMRGRSVDGAERELLDEAGLADGAIPLELWETNPVEQRADAVSGAPGTVGVNLDRLQPAIFAPSILPRLGVAMPRVKSGTYATGTITTSLTAGSHGKGDAAQASAAAFTVSSATPKRISARLAIAIEDVAAVGQANFESVLRENLSLVLSDELDKQGLNGTGGNSGKDLVGIFHRLTDPTAPTTIAKFDDFVAAFAGGVDGLWASTVRDVAIVAGVDTYRLSAKTFRDATGQDLGDIAFSDYAAKYGGWWTNKRMPVKDGSNVQQAILHRKGRSGMRTAICPHWGRISIDDIYTGSASGERYFTMHVLLGDVILVQPDAYAQVAFKTAARAGAKMASLLLIEGPAGSGKSQIVAEMLAAGEADIQADLTSQWVALRGVRRGPDGRYPIRGDDDPTIETGLASYMRATAVRQGLRSGLNVVVTSGSPDTATKWAAVAEDHDVDFRVQTVDPGPRVVAERLADADGRLQDPCVAAIARWYAIDYDEAADFLEL